MRLLVGNTCAASLEFQKPMILLFARWIEHYAPSMMHKPCPRRSSCASSTGHYTVLSLHSEAGRGVALGSTTAQ